MGDRIKYLFIIPIVVFLIVLCRTCDTDVSGIDGEIFVDQVASVSNGNVIITETGMNVHLLGIQESADLGTSFLTRYIGETVHVIEDSHLKQNPVGTDSINGYAVLDNGICINHLLISQVPELFTPINLVDSLDAFRPKDNKPTEITDICLYIKQRSFLIEVPLGGGLSYYGTGFFINDGGLAITNHHVINGDSDAYCYFYNCQGFDDNTIHPELRRDIMKSSIVATDYSLDITVFKVKLLNDEKSQYFNLSSKHMVQGAKVFTMGNPVNQNEVLVGTFSDGTVSGYRNQDGEKPLVQYTLSTNSGNSGGPVCNNYGEVIAVHCMGEKSMQNVNYGVDILAVRNKLNELGLYYGGK